MVSTFKWEAVVITAFGYNELQIFSGENRPIYLVLLDRLWLKSVSGKIRTGLDLELLATCVPEDPSRPRCLERCDKGKIHSHD